MLEFPFVLFPRNHPASHIQGLLIAILPKNAVLAGELFSWLRRTQSEVCQAWIGEFVQAYSTSMLLRQEKVEAPISDRPGSPPYLNRAV